MELDPDPGSPTPEPAPASRPRMEPVTPERYAVQFTMDRCTYELLQQARALLGYQPPPANVVQIFHRALEALVAQLEKRKFGAKDRPRKPTPGASRDPRYIPLHVKRTVWKRDGGRCTFMSDTGQRCPAREALEFDHREPIAQGGGSNLENLRLRCRAHNQYEAERTFGTGFMRRKREGKRAAAVSISTDRAAASPA